MADPVSALGADVLRRGAALGRNVLTLGETLSRTIVSGVHASRGARRHVRRVTVMQVHFTGAQSVPVAGLFAALVGFGTGALVNLVPVLADQPLFVETLLVQQVGPLLAAIVVVARSASAVAVELGNMRVGRELEMLEGFGIDPYRHLGLPRLIGITIGTSALCALTTAIAVGFFLLAVRDLPRLQGIEFATRLASSSGVRVFLLGVLYGLAIALVAMMQGFSLAPQYTEVPKAASRAVVMSLICCAVIDLLLSLTLGAQ